MIKNIWTYVEIDENGITDISLQVLSKGREFADLTNSKLSCIVLGSDLESVADELISHGADKVYLAEDDNLKEYVTTPYKKVVSDLAENDTPEIFLFPGSTQGNDLAPALASELQTGCVMDCHDLLIKDELLIQKKLEYDSKVFSNYVTKSSVPQIATLKDGICEINKADNSREGEVVNVDVALDNTDFVTKVLKREVAAKTVNIKDADIIVAGGAGVGSKENFALIEELANLLGGEVGATRAAVDAGWALHERQIGQTGATVKPELYIACGISGAVQHRVGMLGSKKIIAINTDPNAPIFRFADYRIVGDLTKVIPKLIKVLAN